MASLRILASLVLLSAPVGGVAGDLIDAPPFARSRPGLASVGPRGLPEVKPKLADTPTRDFAVEPAAFQSSSHAKPLLDSGSLWPEDLSPRERAGDAIRGRIAAPFTESRPVASDPTPRETTFTFNHLREPLSAASPTSARAKALRPDRPSVAPLAEPLIETKASVAEPESRTTPARDEPLAAPVATLSAEVAQLNATAAPSVTPSATVATPTAKGMPLGGASKRTASPDFRPANPLNALLAWRPSAGTLATATSALAVVLGLLCVSAWVVKRSLPRSARVLPTDVAEVLGRVPLAGRQVGQLLRVGRKLLLVVVTPTGVETLTEITDEEDVQNLLRICDESHGRGAEAAFDDVFRQMAREPARSGFLGDEGLDYDPRQLAAAYARTPGGRASA
ncbi:MAG: flagellar biosynthetic protein FliO [Lacipirellulaceae bacterium]